MIVYDTVCVYVCNLHFTFQMGYNLDGDLDGYTYTYLCQELPLSRS